MLDVHRYAMYVQDYGAPVGWRLALRNPTEVAAIVTQNANAYRWQYTHGVPDVSTVDPDAWIHDYLAVHRPGNLDVQLALFRDYRTNVELYPDLHRYFQRTQVPLLAVWGGNDQIFGPAGARAFSRHLADAEVHLLDGGHWLLESHLDAVAAYLESFLGRVLRDGPAGGEHPGAG